MKGYASSGVVVRQRWDAVQYLFPSLATLPGSTLLNAVAVRSSSPLATRQFSALLYSVAQKAPCPQTCENSNPQTVNKLYSHEAGVTCNHNYLQFCSMYPLVRRYNVTSTIRIKA